MILGYTLSRSKKPARLMLASFVLFFEIAEEEELVNRRYVNLLSFQLHACASARGMAAVLQASRKTNFDLAGHGCWSTSAFDLLGK